MNQIYKYPRTRHIRGSRMQPGDEDLADVPFAEVAGLHLVVEEKMDGANCAISFDETGRLRLQSRGHYLTGGPNERQFDLFKSWANGHAAALHALLGTRYVLYGEWMYAKHTVYYNALPHYFLEFDILDTEKGIFLDTPTRHAMLRGTPIQSVRVLYAGKVRSTDHLSEMVGPSAFITPGHIQSLRAQSTRLGLRPAPIVAETDPSTDMEGLYIKAEADGQVHGRYKFIRASFLQTVVASGSHWMDRPLVPNQLAPGVNLWT